MSMTLEELLEWAAPHAKRVEGPPIATGWPANSFIGWYDGGVVEFYCDPEDSEKVVSYQVFPDVVSYEYGHYQDTYCAATAETIRKLTSSMTCVEQRRGAGGIMSGAIVTMYRDADGEMWEHVRGRDFTSLSLVLDC